MGGGDSAAILEMVRTRTQSGRKKAVTAADGFAYPITGEIDAENLWCATQSMSYLADINFYYIFIYRVHRLTKKKRSWPIEKTKTSIINHHIRQ